MFLAYLLLEMKIVIKLNNWLVKEVSLQNHFLSEPIILLSFSNQVLRFRSPIMLKLVLFMNSCPSLTSSPSLSSSLPLIYPGSLPLIDHFNTPQVLRVCFLESHLS